MTLQYFTNSTIPKENNSLRRFYLNMKNFSSISSNRSIPRDWLIKLFLIHHAVLIDFYYWSRRKQYTYTNVKWYRYNFFHISFDIFCTVNSIFSNQLYFITFVFLFLQKANRIVSSQWFICRKNWKCLLKLFFSSLLFLLYRRIVCSTLTTTKSSEKQYT